MIYKILRSGFIGLAFVMKSFYSQGQDNRTQYPHFLLNKYIGVNVGYINYFPPNLKLQPGYNAAVIRVPHPGVRIVFGSWLSKHLSVEISYMRPVDWVLYRDVNGDQKQHSVWMNVLGFTMQSFIKVLKNLSVYGEGGFGFVTQGGFKINNSPAFKDASYMSFLFGGGLQYHLNKKWDLMASAVFPAHSKIQKPYKLFFSGGFTYTIRKLPQKDARENSDAVFFFPENMIQAGFATNAFGYGVNAVTEKTYIFWGGDVEVRNGFSIQYQRSVFHSHKVFSLSWGAGLSYWKSRRHNDDFLTLSVFPVFRFTVLHSRSADFYLNYSVAGPTFISRVYIDSNDTGDHFTFQDYMGIGAFIGKNRKLNAEIRIAHYSNGDLIPQNGGIKIPLTFNAGFTF